MATSTEAHRGARVILIPPPLYYVAGLAVGVAVDSGVPLPLGGRPATAIAGVILAVLGLAATAVAVVTVVRHRTTLVPHHPVSTLLTGGVFRLSRNPMYTGLAVVYIGLSLLFGSWWPPALLLPVLIAVRQLVVRPEERYLTRQFGRTYTDYQSRVRRWL